MAAWRIPEQGIAIEDTMLSVTAIDPDNAHAGFRIGILLRGEVCFFEFDCDGRLQRIRADDAALVSPTKIEPIWE